ncbi:MAG TPA: carboxypeptidase regulatory-like domain-containing protein [Longimicrobium sp.]|jgi:hypothetical protein
MKFLSVLIAALACAPTAAAQTVHGRVLDDSARVPIAGALVELVGATGRRVAAVRTDASGAFLLRAGRPGAYTVAAERTGYGAGQRGPIHLTQGDSTSVELVLRTEAVAVAGVTARGVARKRTLDDVGFYDRQRLRLGRFYNRQQIEQQGIRRVTDLLRGLPNFEVRATRFGGYEVVSRSQTARSCRPGIFVDGVRMNQGDGGLGLDATVDSNDLEAVEVYTDVARVPAEYSGAGSSCGAIVIWTRID